jgi:hypothetical protein
MKSIRKAAGLTALGACLVTAAPAMVAAAELEPTLPPPAESGDVSTTCRRAWQAVASPNVGDGENILWAVTASAPDDAWAVGKYDVPGAGSRTLTERWDGSSWRTVPSPNRGLGSWLDGTDGTSPTDVWAVGTALAIPGDEAGARTLIEHWNGRRWTVTPSPNKGIGARGNGFLRGVAAISPGDVWAVGSYLAGVELANLRPLIEHWDGDVWRAVPTPRTGEWTELKAVSASGPNDVWVVGGHDVRVGDAISQRAVTLHWNGSTWRQARTPLPGDPLSPFILDDVVTLSPSNAWAVGTVSDRSHRSVVMHWNGTAWKIVPSVNPSAQYQSFAGVTAVSPREVWAVGSYWDATAARMRPLVERWDGQRFHQVPTVTRRDSQLRAVAAVAGGLFAVGSAGLPERTLIVQTCPTT